MKIGIIVHSQTGHTYEVAQKLQEKLLVAGNEVEIEQIRLEGGQQTPDKNSQIENPPDVNAYDALIFRRSSAGIFPFKGNEYLFKPDSIVFRIKKSHFLSPRAYALTGQAEPVQSAR